MLTITPIATAIAAVVTGLDIGAGVTPAESAALREALARHQVLVIPGQTVTDAAQIAFSEGFGALEATRAGADGAGSKVIVLTNIAGDGGIAAPSAPGAERAGQPGLASRQQFQAGAGADLDPVGARDPVGGRQY